MMSLSSVIETTTNLIRRSSVLRMSTRYLTMTSTNQLQQSGGGSEGDSSGKSKHFTVTRIYSDEDGQSRFGSFKIRMDGSGDIGYLSKLIGAAGVVFRQTPGDYHYSWHNAPQRQFIVNLDADVEVEVCSGEKRLIRQGEVFFVEDTTGKGHFSRAVEGRTRHSIFIPVSDDFKAEDLGS